jgi:hypothetical protein
VNYEEEQEFSEEEVAPEEVPEPAPTAHMKWYAVGTFSNYENWAKILLEENMKTAGV